MIARNHGPLFASAEAATRAAPRASGDRLRILRALAEHGPMTDEGLQTLLQMNPSTERPRRGELVDDGFVRDSGRTGRTHSGCRAVLWEITEAGRAEVGR